MDQNIKLIRSVMLSKHGGLQDATDHAIMTVWKSLDADTQKRYLSEQQEKSAEQTKTGKDK